MTRRLGRRAWVDRRQPRVLDVAPGLIHESGPDLGRAWAPERLALMAHWSMSPVPSRSVVTLLQELDSSGFETVLVSAAQVPGKLVRECPWAPGEAAMPERTTVLRRVNVGYDFGSWASALAAFPGVSGASRVLLVNDSLIGPFGPLNELLEDFEVAPGFVWGALAANYPDPHLQSFLVGYKEQVLRATPLRSFWSEVRVESGKNKVIRYGELGLSAVLRDSGLGWGAAITPPRDFEQNPALHAPLSLLRQGFPFLKRGVVEQIRSGEQWDALAREVEGLYGTELSSWFERPIEIGPCLSRRAATMEELRAVRDLKGPVAAGRHLARKGRLSLQSLVAPTRPSAGGHGPPWGLDEDAPDASRF